MKLSDRNYVACQRYLQCMDEKCSPLGTESNKNSYGVISLVDM